MSDDEGVKQCPNCKLDIFSSNFIIHYVHCQRNFYLCSKCEQPVNYDKKTEHDNENHVIVQCSGCELALEKCHLDNHLSNDCPNRKLKCQICDIDIKAVDIIEHEDYCGSRTEKCPECSEFVMLKYKSLHLDSNHTFIKLSDEPGPSPSWQFGKRTLCNFIPDFSLKNYKSAPVGKKKQSETLGRSKNLGSNESNDETGAINRTKLDLLFCDVDDQVKSNVSDNFEAANARKLKTRDVDEWPVLSGLRSLSISEEVEENSTALQASNSRPNKINENSDMVCALQMPHEINSEISGKKVWREAEVFQNCFEPLSENNTSAVKLVVKDMLKKKPNNDKEEYEISASKNDFINLHEKHENVKLPCEFCEKLIVSHNLISHQSRCISKMSDSFNQKSSEYKKNFYFDEDIEKKIACGLCNKFFRLSLLENHQLHCQRNPAKSLKRQAFSKSSKSVNLKYEPGLQNKLESSSLQHAQVGITSEQCAKLSRRSGESKDIKNHLDHPQSEAVTRSSKVSRKSKRAPSPPAR